jgi:hypothetical protein
MAFLPQITDAMSRLEARKATALSLWRGRCAGDRAPAVHAPDAALINGLFV